MLNNNKIIGDKIKIENFELAENDFPNKLNHYDAKLACGELGERWRLPTKEMFKKILQCKYQIKNIKLEYYWSSSIVRFTQYPVESAWAQNFNNCDNQIILDQYFFPLISLHNVRAIKVTYFDFNIINIIGRPLVFENLEIAQFDFPEEMYWEDAIDFFSKLGSDWRLPDQYEITALNNLFKDYVESTINYSKTYWCIENIKTDIISPVGFHFSKRLDGPTYTIYSMMPNIKYIYEKRRVRAVRSL